MSISKWSFNKLGEEVTFQIRNLLYESILRKHMGFHDYRENGSAVLTSAMAEDSAIINGVSTESVGPMVDGYCGLLIGLALGLAYSWKLALVCCAIAPLLSLGAIINMRATMGAAKEGA